MSELGGMRLWNERAAGELLMGLTTALDKGDLATYANLVKEAATEPDVASVLIEVLVRLMLHLSTHGAEVGYESREGLLAELVGEATRRYYGTETT